MNVYSIYMYMYVYIYYINEHCTVSLAIHPEQWQTCFVLYALIRASECQRTGLSILKLF